VLISSQRRLRRLSHGTAIPASARTDQRTDLVLLQIIQYAKHKGIKTINVVRRDERIQELKDTGCAWF
jgi:hypothetical protein